LDEEYFDLVHQLAFGVQYPSTDHSNLSIINQNALKLMLSFSLHHYKYIFDILDSICSQNLSNSYKCFQADALGFIPQVLFGDSNERYESQSHPLFKHISSEFFSPHYLNLSIRMLYHSLKQGIKPIHQNFLHVFKELIHIKFSSQ
jgi:hypothetical protein